MRTSALSKSKREVVSNQGFSLIEAIVYLGLAMAVMIGAYSVLKISSDMSKSANIFVSLHDIRATILESLKNDTAFSNSLAAPVNANVFACINNKTDCANQGGQFNLFDAQGKQMTTVATPGTSEGFNNTGAPCTAFDPSLGNDTCAFRYVASWSPACPATGGCINPVVQLKIDLKVAPKDISQVGKINVTSFEIFYVKSNLTASLSDTCTKMGGTLNPDQSCTMPFYSGPCPTGQYLRGFDNSGSKVCQHLKGFNCPLGQVLLGVDGSGTAYCGPGCTDPVGSSSGSIW
jgi:hypothetical protein